LPLGVITRSHSALVPSIACSGDSSMVIRTRARPSLSMTGASALGPARPRNPAFAARPSFGIDINANAHYNFSIRYIEGVFSMRFQPGQSGNPGGRPPGARNRKTLEVEALLAEQAVETAKDILDRAQRGEPAAMRLCMERIAPVGANRPILIELPPVDTPDDVAAAARAVMKALCDGAISAREAISLLTVVERLARIAERVQQMKERHAVWRDGAGLYSPVNSQSAAGAEPLYSPVNSANEDAGEEPGSPAAQETAGERLYSPVNSRAAAADRSAAVADPPPGQGLYRPVNSLPVATEAALDRPIAASGPVGSEGTILGRRRRALMASVAPGALNAAVLQPIDPRSYVTEQTWLASMFAGKEPFPSKRNAA
jgi:Family of unknown function (DUF5681)